jgi:hypothetical protein
VTSQLSVSLALVALYFLSIPIAYLLSPKAQPSTTDGET